MDKTDLYHIQKENFEIIDLYCGKYRPKVKKTPEKSGDPLPVYFAHPSKSWNGLQKCMKLFLVVVPIKNQIFCEKKLSKVPTQKI